MKNNKINQKLSLYIDGKLSSNEEKEILYLLENNQNAKNTYNQLLKLKSLLSSNKKIKPDIGFWTRLSTKLNQQEKEYKFSWNIKGAFAPAIYALTITAILVGIYFFNFNNTNTKNNFDIADANQKNNWLPFFSQIDKDNAIQFSLLGTLSLDDKNKSILKIDNSSKNGYKIEVEKDVKSLNKKITYNNFLLAVKPNKSQKQTIDSLLTITEKNINSSVLIGDNNKMIISPELSKLNRKMVSNIASCLGTTQQQRFKNFLESNDAPYTFVASNIITNKNDYYSIEKKPKNNNYVLITPDTVMYSNITINHDSINANLENNTIVHQLKREAVLKQLLSNNNSSTHKKNITLPNARYFKDSTRFGLELDDYTNDESYNSSIRIVAQPHTQR